MLNEETKNISLIAEKEAKGILKELSSQEERLVEIQRVAGEGKGLLFINQKLIEHCRKNVGAKCIVASVIGIFVIFGTALIKIKYF